MRKITSLQIIQRWKCNWGNVINKFMPKNLTIQMKCQFPSKIKNYQNWLKKKQTTNKIPKEFKQKEIKTCHCKKSTNPKGSSNGGNKRQKLSETHRNTENKQQNVSSKSSLTSNYMKGGVGGIYIKIIPKYINKSIKKIQVYMLSLKRLIHQRTDPSIYEATIHITGGTNTVLVGDLNAPLSIMDQTTRERTEK